MPETTTDRTRDWHRVKLVSITAHDSLPSDAIESAITAAVAHLGTQVMPINCEVRTDSPSPRARKTNGAPRLRKDGTPLAPPRKVAQLNVTIGTAAHFAERDSKPARRTPNPLATEAGRADARNRLLATLRANGMPDAQAAAMADSMIAALITPQ